MEQIHSYDILARHRDMYYIPTRFNLDMTYNKEWQNHFLETNNVICNTFPEEEHWRYLLSDILDLFSLYSVMYLLYW